MTSLPHKGIRELRGRQFWTRRLSNFHTDTRKKKKITLFVQMIKILISNLFSTFLYLIKKNLSIKEIFLIDINKIV